MWTDRDRERQTETETDRDRQTETERDRQRQRQTETDRERQTETETATETDWRVRQHGAETAEVVRALVHHDVGHHVVYHGAPHVPSVLVWYPAPTQLLQLLPLSTGWQHQHNHRRCRRRHSWHHHRRRHRRHYHRCYGHNHNELIGMCFSQTF